MRFDCSFQQRCQTCRQVYVLSFEIWLLVWLPRNPPADISPLTGNMRRTHPPVCNPCRTRRTWCSRDADCGWQKFYGQKEKTSLVTAVPWKSNLLVTLTSKAYWSEASRRHCKKHLETGMWKTSKLELHTCNSRNTVQSGKMKLQTFIWNILEIRGLTHFSKVHLYIKYVTNALRTHCMNKYCTVCVLQLDQNKWHERPVRINHWNAMQYEQNAFRSNRHLSNPCGQPLL